MGLTIRPIKLNQNLSTIPILILEIESNALL